MKMTSIILPILLAGTLLSCQQDPEIFRVPGRTDNETNTEAPEGAGDGLKVCSFNIRYYNTSDPYPWSARKEPILRFLNTELPDLISMQEIRSTQSQDLQLGLSDNYTMYNINRDTGTQISGSEGEGVGLLYRKDRFELIDKGFFWLAEDPDKLPSQNEDGTYSSWHSKCRRVTVWAKLKDNWHSGQTVWFFATHFDHVSSEARRKSSEMTLKQISKITGISDLSKSGAPIFLAGDHNCSYGSSELEPIRAKMNDARTNSPETEDGTTINGFGSSKPNIIDHIFFVGRFKAQKYHIVTEDYGVKYISDHYPVIFTGKYL